MSVYATGLSIRSSEEVDIKQPDENLRAYYRSMQNFLRNVTALFKDSGKCAILH